MLSQIRHYAIYLMIGGLLLPSCGGLSATPPPDLVATEVAVQKTAAFILTAEAPTETPTQIPTDTPTPEPPTVTSAPAPPPAAEPPATDAAPTTTAEDVVPSEPTDTPTTRPLCTVNTSALNLRSGPGTIYTPNIGALPAGTELSPVAYNPAGFPGGQWLQVLTGGQVGWVSADPQFISCNVNLADFPPGDAPPTPTSTFTLIPTNTPTIPPPRTRRSVPPDGGDLDSRIFKTAKILLPDNAEIRNGTVTFRHRIYFQLEVFDPVRGNSDGAGIRRVRFTITDPDEGRVHDRTENNAGYCVFGGGEPNCNEWVPADHGNRWPDGDRLNTSSTVYSVDFEVDLENGDEVNWMWRFRFER